MFISVHAYPPEVAPYHIHGMDNTLLTITIVELYNDKRC